MSNEKYCHGCGVLLQDENILNDGYTTSLENDLCQRCFRLKNYGEYKVVSKTNDDYLSILKSVAKTKDLVLFIVDILNLETHINTVKEHLPNKMILVINKSDVLPKSVKEKKLIEYVKSLDYDFADIVVISSNKNHNIDLLLSKIKKHQTSNDVYVVGHTNVGKSSLINQLIKNYADHEQELTISPMPSTTLEKLEIIINKKLTIIDTPGLITINSLVNYITDKQVKKLSPKKEIKPKTYQMRKGQSIIIEDFLRIDYIEGEKNSFTLYVSNDLKVKRLLVGARNNDLKDLSKKTMEVKYREDLVMMGLGFIKIADKSIIDIYHHKDIDSYIRKSLI